MKWLLIIFSFSALLTLTACGGGGASSSTAETEAPIIENSGDNNTDGEGESSGVLTGVFFDAAVEGLAYRTDTFTGETNAQGEFLYRRDEQITFSIGGVDFPEILADGLVTPLSVFSTDDVTDVRVTNMLRLLQTLDMDGVAENGIVLPNNIHSLATDMTVDFGSGRFDDEWANVVAQSGAANTFLVTAGDAQYHFEQSLQALESGEISFCAKTHEKVGWSGTFQTYAHNVSGVARIVDDCTIEVSQFTYDGEGPDVYFYGALDRLFSSPEAFSIGNQLNGQVYVDSTISLRLPANKTLDDLTGLSVWCVDFNANFGDVEFTP
ncbi:DM13 domain-containing protein [Echinimonas agarilytica]|uniref:DM13 domain-containing protein n=1 Tax=Echinimonas agarilytica TaxID=1215918 RepID=A0AA41W925_9GAMM|nr:DM13 domain-containing protein [Echinimonas agarilytica]MCM2681334.1 DM13 domain-containing protein [Echinimonas agarilytica]